MTKQLAILSLLLIFGITDSLAQHESRIPLCGENVDLFPHVVFRYKEPEFSSLYRCTGEIVALEAEIPSNGLSLRGCDLLLRSAERKWFDHANGLFRKTNAQRAYDWDVYGPDIEGRRLNVVPQYRGPRDLYLTYLALKPNEDRTKINVIANGCYSISTRVLENMFVKKLIELIEEDEYFVRDLVNGSITIDPSILEEGIGDDQFLEKLRASVRAYFEIEQNRLRLGFAPQKVRTFVDDLVNNRQVTIAGFSTGSPYVSALVVTFTRQVVLEQLKTSVREARQSGKMVRVISDGFTDSKPFKRGGGEHYNGLADLSTPVGAVQPFVEPTIGQQVKEQIIRSNAQLSAARAYEGIALLYALIPDDMRDHITFFYRGNGDKLANELNDSGSRKITYRIEIIE